MIEEVARILVDAGATYASAARAAASTVRGLALGLALRSRTWTRCDVAEPRDLLANATPRCGRNPDDVAAERARDLIDSGMPLGRAWRQAYAERDAKAEAEPSDDEIYNRPGVEGGIGYKL